MKAKDYRSGLEPVWCTGCGDFGVLKGLTQALADLEIAPEKLAVDLRHRLLEPAAGLHALVRVQLDPRPRAADRHRPQARAPRDHHHRGGRRRRRLQHRARPPAARDPAQRATSPTPCSTTASTGSPRARPRRPPSWSSSASAASPAPTSDRSIRCCCVLGSGCGFVARTHAGNLPHLREMFREAIRYPGFAFVHVLAGCVTYQKPSYAEQIYQRCDLLPDDYDPYGLRARRRARARRALRARRPVLARAGYAARGAVRRGRRAARCLAAGQRIRTRAGRRVPR